MEADLEAYEREATDAITAARNAFETATALEAERRGDLIEIRSRELQRNADDTRKEFEDEETRLREEEGGVPSSIAEEHKARLDELEGIIRVTQQRMEKERTDAEKAARVIFDAQEVTHTLGSGSKVVTTFLFSHAHTQSLLHTKFKPVLCFYF